MQWIFKLKWRGQMDMERSEWLAEWLSDWLTEWLTEWLSEWLKERRTCLMWCCPLLADCCMFGLSLLVRHLSVLGSALLWSYFFLLFFLFFWSSLALIDQLNSFVNNFLPTMTRHKEHRCIPHRRKTASSKSGQDLFGLVSIFTRESVDLRVG